MNKAISVFFICLAAILAGCNHDVNISGAFGDDSHSTQPKYDNEIIQTTITTLTPTPTPTPTTKSTQPQPQTQTLTPTPALTLVPQSASTPAPVPTSTPMQTQAPAPDNHDSANANAYANVTVVVSGKATTFVGQQAIYTDGEVFVPVHGVFEHLDGANGNTDSPFTVGWDSQLSTATIKNRWYTVIITSGEQGFICNGDRVTPAAPQRIIDGEFMLPLMSITKAIDATVQWDEEKNTISIFYESMIITG